jgi:hypothetical protein
MLEDQRGRDPLNDSNLAIGRTRRWLSFLPRKLRECPDMETRRSNRKCENLMDDRVEPRLKPASCAIRIPISHVSPSDYVGKAHESRPKHEEDPRQRVAAGNGRTTALGVGLFRRQ